MSSPFVHLHVHSQYSILDSTASIPDLVRKATACKMPALALTDHGNLFGAVEFYKACKEAGIKPLIGCELYLAPTSRHVKQKLTNLPPSFHLTVIAKNATGYQNLMVLSSLGYTEGFYYTPRIDFELLAAHHEGLILLSGCRHSPFAHECLRGTPESLRALVDKYRGLFGDDFYFEVMRHAMSREDQQLDGLLDEPWLLQHCEDALTTQTTVNNLLFDLARTCKIPVVATNDCHYIERTDWRAHEVLINVQSGEPCELLEHGVRSQNPKRSVYPTHEQYFKTSEEMAALFADHPEALAATNAIADSCSLSLDLSTKHYPVYLPPTLPATYSEPERVACADNYLRDLCEQAIPTRYTAAHLAHVQDKYPGQDPLEVLRKRLDYELHIITSKGMTDYILIVWDFISWSKSQGIPVGPGRGSGAGSIILYLIGVTNIEPLRFHLLFERFINPERLSYPDIDVDLCMDRRNEVINYTIQKYGKDRVAQIITFGTMKAKMAVKDVGRTLNVPLPKVNSIAKLIPDDLDITIDKALAKDHDLQALYSNDEETHRLIDLAKTLEGSTRNQGLHAAGLIISGRPLTELVPVCTAKDSAILVTQFSMKPAELVGLLKMDFLGLKTLTCIHTCCATLPTPIDWTNLPLDDPNTFALINQGHTLGVFQIESGGMQDLAKQIHIDTFEEIIALVALYRPGPMDLIPSFIARKHKTEAIDYDHPWLESILAETYGIMVYQEQVMQIASKLGNYSLGEGDVLRRAMGKKDAKAMATQRTKFLEGAKQNAIPEDAATRIFDKMEKFAEYGFNKSHAAAYGYLTYVTAYLKAHYPSEWLAALMTCDRDDLEKVARFIHEGRVMGLATLPPDINESGMYFVATPQGIRFALSGIKGVGAQVVEHIITGRARGPYTSLQGFIERVTPARIPKKTIELLIDAGCFDALQWHRDELKAIVESLYTSVAQELKERAAGILSLFGPTRTTTRPQLAVYASRQQQLLREKELLGFFLTGHPLAEYAELTTRFGAMLLQTILQGQPGVFRCALLIETIAIKIASTSQKKFAILTVSDASGTRFELPVWPKLYEEQHQLLVENRLYVAVITKELKQGEPSYSCNWIADLPTLTEQALAASNRAYDQAIYFLQRVRPAMGPKATPAPPKRLAITIDADLLRASHILKLRAAFTAAPGPNAVELRFTAGQAPLAALQVSSKHAVSSSAALQKALQAIPSVVAIE